MCSRLQLLHPGSTEHRPIVVNILYTVIEYRTILIPCLFVFYSLHSILCIFYNNSSSNNSNNKKMYQCCTQFITSISACQHVFDRDTSTLTPSLPQPVKCPGWKMQGHASKQSIFRPYNICCQCYVIWWQPFHTPVRKRRPKGLKGFKFITFIGRFQVTSWQLRG